MSHQSAAGTPLDFSLLGEPHEQGLVFKWGSLVGIRMPSTGANLTSPFVAGDVAFRPREFTGAITTWASVPYCKTDFVLYGDKTVDHLVQVHDPSAGLGDICRYMGLVDGTRWRIPTTSEWAELYGSTEQDKGQATALGSGWVDGNYYPLSGRAYGPHKARVAIISNTQVDNANPYINGAVFLSANGLREAENGAIWWIGSCGFYWSSTVLTTLNGYNIEFNGSNVWPQNPASRIWARSIRCIRE